MGGMEIRCWRRFAGCPEQYRRGHRCFLLKLHFNVPMTSGRILKAGLGHPEDCCFCGQASGDGWDHITTGGMVLSVCDRLCAAGRMPVTLQLAHRSLMLQDDLDGSSVAALVAIFVAVWRIRARLRMGCVAPSQEQLYDLVVKCIECPSLVGCLPSLDRAARRQKRS